MKAIFLTIIFIFSTNAIAETIDEKRHRTAPFAKEVSSESENQLSREQYTLIAESMAASFKNDLDDEGRDFFMQKVAEDNGCTIASTNSTYLITCP